MKNKYDHIEENKNLGNYVDEIDDTHGFSKDNIIVEHRSNNAKRDFLFVNKAQCMHIPNDPDEILGMCAMLAKRVKDALPHYERIAVVGFAETATAIGNLVADNLPGCRFAMTTTREDAPRGETVISFKEEHSHAPAQKLVTYSHVDMVKDFDYILFVEDEISTGKTILNFINAFEEYALKRGDKKLPHFGVASICNWQDDENRKKFDDRKVDVIALIYGKLKDEGKKMDAAYFRTEPFNRIPYTKESGIFTSAMAEERMGHAPGRTFPVLYRKCMEEYEKAMQDNRFYAVRVIGTEECKYPAIKLAKSLKAAWPEVKVSCQSTTRSPIDVMSLGGDGITSKYAVPSVYNGDRKNYIYNINPDALNIIVTDAVMTKKAKKAFRSVLGKNCIFLRID